MSHRITFRPSISNKISMSFVKVKTLLHANDTFALQYDIISFPFAYAYVVFSSNSTQNLNNSMIMNVMGKSRLGDKWSSFLLLNKYPLKENIS